MDAGWPAGRAQTAVVGNLLLVAIGIVLVAVVGVAAFALLGPVEEVPPTAEIDAEVGSRDLTVDHVTGAVIATADLSVVLRTPATSLDLPLENLWGHDGRRFQAGDAARLAHGVTEGEVSVAVVHEPSNAVIDRERRDLTNGSVGLAAFDAAVPTNDYAGGQTGQGSTTVADGGRTVRLTGNQWKYVDYAYDVTPETMLTFEFKSTAEGDIHGIGLEEQTGGQDDRRVVRVYGTQPWGHNVTAVAGDPYYSAGEDWRRYTVPIGAVYDPGDLGPADHLVVVMDCDPNGPSQPRSGCKSQTDDGTPTATAYFRNIEVYERAG